MTKYAEKMTNELCALFDTSDKEERTAYIEELHKCEVMLFKMSIYSPAIVKIIKAPIDAYFVSRYSSTKKGITRIARGLRSEITGLTIRSRSNSEEVKTALNSDLESTLAYIVMSLTLLSEADDEEKDLLVDQTAEMFENILLHESIRAKVFRQIRIIDEKYKSLKRAFARTMRDDLNLRGKGLAEDILINDFESESVEFADLDEEEFTKIRKNLILRHSVLLDELLIAIGIGSADELGALAPSLASAYFYQDRISKMRYTVVFTTESFIHQIVKRRVPNARGHAISHDDVVQTCLARLIDNIFSYNPMYSLTTFAKFYIDLDCKEQLEKSSMVRLKQLMAMQKTVIEGGLVSDEYGEKRWCWQASQDAIKKRYKIHLDQKVLNDIRFGFTCTDSIHAEGESGETYALTDALGMGYNDEHIEESMLVEEVLSLMSNLTDVEQGIIRRRLMSEIDTDNPVFKGMQFNEEEVGHEVLTEIRAKLTAVKEHLR